MASVGSVGRGTGRRSTSAASLEAELSDNVVPCKVVALDETFRADVEVRLCGPILVVDVAGAALEVESRPQGAASGGVVFKLFLRGRGMISSAGTCRTVEAGALTLVPLEQSFTCRKSGSFACRSIVVPEEALQSVGLSDAARSGAGLLDASVPEARLLSNYAAVAHIEDEPSDFNMLIGEHLLDLAVATIARVAGREDPTGGRGLGAVRVDQALRIIASEFGDRSLNEVSLARRLGLSPRYVDRLFETRGRSFSSILLDTRLSYVRRRLCGAVVADLTADDLAKSAGFDSGSSLMRAYRVHFGELLTVRDAGVRLGPRPGHSRPPVDPGGRLSRRR